MESKRKIAGFFRQILIIQWKNLLLYFNNKIGILFEILFLSTSLIFLLFSYYDEMTRMSKSDFQVDHILSTEPGSAHRPDNFYYYPDNPFIKNIVTNAISDMRFDYIIYPLGLSDPNPDTLKSMGTNMNKVFAFVTFPSYYNSSEYVDERIKYTIHMTELEFIFLIFLKKLTIKNSLFKEAKLRVCLSLDRKLFQKANTCSLSHPNTIAIVNLILINFLKTPLNLTLKSTLFKKVSDQTRMFTRRLIKSKIPLTEI